MKLVESPIKHNLNLGTYFPNITKYLFDHVCIKQYTVYTIDRVQVIYVDAYEKVYLVMFNKNKKIKHSEIDFAIHNLLHTDRELVQIDRNVKKRMSDTHININNALTDLLLISMEVSH
ncbi:MAG: DUF1827 family protein [Enterococcus sp.]